MLPETIHPGDVKWFQSVIVQIPVHHRVVACEGYSKVWQAAYDAEPKPHCKENAGRFAANTRLREYIKKVHASVQR